MESALNPKPGSVIREQAAEWYLARKEGLDAARMQKFARWLATSPEHLAEYHAMERLGRDLPRVTGSAPAVEELLGQVSAADEEEGTVIPFATRSRARAVARRRNPSWAMAAAFAIVAVGAALLWPRIKDLVAPQVPAQTFASEPGNVTQVQIEPGFKFTLDTGSELALTSIENGRQVLLKRGGAMFDIQHDPARENVVLAGVATVRDVGTKFEVYLLPDEAVRVTVLEGEVEVSSQGVSGTRLLGKDQQIVVVPGRALTEPAPVDASRALSWSRGEVFLEGVSVQEAVAEFNRYQAKPVRIESPGLGKEVIHHPPIRTADVDAFLDFLSRSLGVRVDRNRPDQIVVTSP